MTKVALLGAGGKMGVRLATNLAGSRFEVDHVEISAEGRQRLKSAIGVDCVDQDKALAQADIVLMAVPDRLIGKIAHSIVEKVRPGTALIVLDAAAPHAGEMPDRPDLTAARALGPASPAGGPPRLAGGLGDGASRVTAADRARSRRGR